MRRGLLAGALALAAAQGGSCTCNPGPDVAPDTCSDPATSGITAVFAGPADDDFVPWVAGAIVSPIVGPQGDLALPMRFRLEGPAVPGCVPHRSQLYACPAGAECASGGELLADDEVPLRTYAADGARETKLYYLVLNGVPPANQAIRLESTLGGVGQVLTLWVESVGPVLDAGPPDAAPPDAGPPDAAPPDAGPPDAAP